VALKPGDIMMLSSDGLHGVVTEADMEHILLDESNPALHGKCEELIAAANHEGGPDNVTVLLIRRAG
jgi:protein phosphatase